MSTSDKNWNMEDAPTANGMVLDDLLKPTYRSYNLDKQKTLNEWIYCKKSYVRKPCRVVLKASTHYKVGKHRLTLKEVGYRLYLNLPNYVNKEPQDFAGIINLLELYDRHYPKIWNPKIRTKSIKTKHQFILQKGFFNF